jgi:hypothetical protein
VEYLHSLDSNNKDSSILSLVGITRVFVADIVVVGEEVVDDYIKDIADIDEVWERI